MALIAKRPRHVPLDLWDDMSADARYTAISDGNKMGARVSLIQLMLIAPMASFSLLPFVQTWVYEKFPTHHYVKLNGNADPRKYLNTENPIVDDVIAGHAVTSAFGSRVHPVTFETHHHNGTDLSTPTGTPLYAPAVGADKVSIKCWSDDNGGGLVATIKSESVPGYKFKAAHLDTCEDGSYSAGQKFATTGNTGTSTGPHLHFMQVRSADDINVDPQTGHIDWVLSGNAGVSFIDMDALKDAIASKESGHNYSAVNPHSNALGKFQVMPDNIDTGAADHGWDYDALGRDITPDEFLNSPQLQEEIVTHQLSQIALTQSDLATDESNLAGRVGSVWYSGSAQCDNNSTQYYGAGTYPSIADYCGAISDNYNSIQRKRLAELDRK